MARTKRGGRRSGKERIRRSKEEWEEMKRQNPDLGKPKGYKLGPKTNDAFETFYKGIGIVPEGEWETFLETMRKALPTTFRITGSRDQAEELLKIIKGQYFSKFICRDDGSPKLEPKSLPWYPDELAWQIDFTKKQIKNDNTLKSLHGFLISETESGNISRQEAVSMLPPLLMGIEPHHKILDMCAAPGSKTAQLIEMLHSDENVPVPSGYVVANDMDNKRCYLMTHQVKRIQSPNCMIINHDARILPNMFTSTDENAEVVKYDRILCDVPCSGDGTMRKNPDIWNKWHVNGAYNLHRIQKKVLQRGLELLAVGGRLVYSTCSLNPIEDEAVILTLIKQCKGAVELVDVSNKLPGLTYSKGTYSWKIMTKKGEWYETEEQAPDQFKNCWDSTMYPPIITEAQDAKLERCIRVLPHQQNTGAFFIAVIHKTQELPWLSGKTHRRTEPVINPRNRQDESEKKIAGSEHFTFGVRSAGGLYIYARCNLCNAKLQGKNDYNSHLQGKKHQKELEDRKAIQKERTATETQEAKSENAETSQVSMETENNGTVKTEVTESVLDSAHSEAKENDKAATETQEARSETAETSQVSMETENNITVKTEVTESAVDSEDLSKQTKSDKSEKADNVDNIETKRKRTDSDVAETEGKTDEESVVKSEETGEQSQKEAAGDSADNQPPAAKKARMETYDEEIKVVMYGHREDPFLFCSKNDPIWPNIQTFYDISEDLGVEQIMYRNMKRVLYYVSKPIRNLVICNSERVKEYVWVNKMPGVPRGVMWPAKIISGTADAHDVAIYVKSDNAEMTVKKANICPFDVSLKDKFQKIVASGRKQPQGEDEQPEADETEHVIDDVEMEMGEIDEPESLAMAPAKHQKKSKVMRVRWMEAETSELLKYAHEYLEKRKTPSRNVCKSFIASSKAAGGELHKRSADNILKKISAMNVKARKTDE